MVTSEWKAIVEGLLLAAEGPLRAERIAEALEVERGEVVQLLCDLAAEYEETRRGFVLQEIADGYQLRTRPEHAEYHRRLGRTRPFRFSRAALETLAIVAYRQPVTRAEIEYLRGVDAGGVLKTLLDRRLVRILGKRDIPGRPVIYGTSREFLEFFGLRDLSALPTLKEFNEIAPESLELPAAAAALPMPEEGCE